MKQVLYTCTRCGQQEAVDLKEPVPMEWATIQYMRIHTVTVDGKESPVQTTSETHACGDCAQGVLDYIEATLNAAENETAPGPGDQQALANFTGELLRSNGKMFEGTIRVLHEQNMNLHEQVTSLTVQNAILIKELGNAVANARPQS